MKKASLIISIISVTLTAWILAFPDKNPFRLLFAKKEQSPPRTPNPYQPIAAPTAPTGAFMPNVQVVSEISGFPLKQGSRGQWVKNVQAALNNRFGSSLAVDGIFGPKTYRAISANGFNADSVSWSEYKSIVGI